MTDQPVQPEAPTPEWFYDLLRNHSRKELIDVLSAMTDDAIAAEVRAASQERPPIDAHAIDVERLREALERTWWTHDPDGAAVAAESIATEYAREPPLPSADEVRGILAPYMAQERPPIDVLTQAKAALMTDPILSSNLLVKDQIAVVIDRLSRSVASPEPSEPGIETERQFTGDEWRDPQ